MVLIVQAECDIFNAASESLKRGPPRSDICEHVRRKGIVLCLEKKLEAVGTDPRLQKDAPGLQGNDTAITGEKDGFLFGQFAGNPKHFRPPICVEFLPVLL